MTYKKQKPIPLQTLLKTIDIRLLAIKIEEPNRENLDWVAGLTDNESNPKMNYFRCETHEDAQILLKHLIDNYNVLEGENIGIAPKTVYLIGE